MEEIQLTSYRLVVYPTIFRVLYIPSGAGFLPSTVSTSCGDWFFDGGWMHFPLNHCWSKWIKWKDVGCGSVNSTLSWLPTWTVSKASRQSTSLLSRAKQQLLCPHCSKKQNSIMHNSVVSWKVISANMQIRTSVKCIVNRKNGQVVITFCWQVFTDPFQVFFDWIQSGGWSFAGLILSQQFSTMANSEIHKIAWWQLASSPS